MQSVHVQHVSQLLLQIVSVLKTRHSRLSLKEIDCCHRICLHLLYELLRTSSPLSQLSSLASTPSLSSPFPSTPTPPPSSAGGTLADIPTHYRSFGQATPDEEKDFLSHGDTILKVYDDYLAFYSEFLASRVLSSATVGHRGDTAEDKHASFSSVCSTLILLTSLILQSDAILTITESDAVGPPSSSAASRPLGPPTLAPWLSSLMEVCQARSSPPLALVALETLLTLVEMATTQPYEAVAPGGIPPSIPPSSPAVEYRIITPRMVEKVVLTQQFVKVWQKYVRVHITSKFPYLPVEC